MAKIATLLTIALLLCTALTCTSRPEPALSTTPAKTQHLEILEPKHDGAVEEICERAEDEEDCLMRRTLAAHIDYIYTQQKKP